MDQFKRKRKQLFKASKKQAAVTKKTKPEPFVIENPKYDNEKHLISYKFNEEERSKVPRLTDENFLEEFLFPMTIPQFLSNVYKKKAYATTPNGEGKANLIRRCANLIKNHLFELDLSEMLENTASENIFVWMREKTEGEESDDTKSGPIESFELESGAINSAKICYNAGGSLYFRSSQEMADMFVRQVGEALGINFGGYYPANTPGLGEGSLKGEIETFVSRKGHVTDWHFDFMENFTVQLKGSKTWKLYSSGIPHPLRGCTPHYKNIDTIEQQLKIHRLHDPHFQFQPDSFEGYSEVTLTEGSILYHPAGIWHRVECEEDSISINISLFPSSWADIIADSIHHLLWSKPETRESILIKDKESARKHMAELLAKTKKWINELNPEDILPNSLFTPRTPVVEVESSQDIENYQITANTKFTKNPLAMLIEVPSRGKADDEENEIPVGETQKRFALHINYGNESLDSAVRIELIIEEDLSDLVNQIAEKREPFTRSSLKTDIAEDRIVQLLKVLQYQGLLRKI